MSNKTAVIVLSIVLFGGTAALANDNGANSGEVGGIKVGPLGQRFDNPYANGAFAFAPLTTKQVHGKKRVRAKQTPADEDN